MAEMFVQGYKYYLTMHKFAVMDRLYIRGQTSDSKGGTGIMSVKAKHKKLLIIGAVSLAVILIAALFIWLFVLPEKLLEYTSSDSNITVVISQYKAIAPFADPDYNIKIKKNDGIFGTTLLNEDFWFDSFHHGQLDENDIEIKWYDDYVEVFIKFSKGGWHSFKAEF